jgi:peptidoglycan-N-acetylglucosamine deacetylase
VTAGVLWSAAGIALAGAGAHATFHRNSPLFGRALSRLPTRERVVALTFDDGPHPDNTPRVLDVLADEGVAATFFVLGRHAERWPNIVRRAVNEGHEVANHGYFHQRLHFAGPGRVRADLERGTATVARASGIRPRFFRAPHGFRSPFVTPVAKSLGQTTVGWTYGVWDSDRPGANEIARRTLAAARPGAIVLLHDADGHDPDGDRRQTAEALPAIIRGLKDRGYQMVTLLPAG